MKQNSTLHLVIDNFSEDAHLLNVDEALSLQHKPEFKEVFKHLNSYKRTVREEVVHNVLNYARNLQK
jgi:uncharacterized protein YpiB (UPF0302 family)